MQPFAYCGIARRIARRAAALLCALALCLPLAACGKAPQSAAGSAPAAQSDAALPKAQGQQAPAAESGLKTVLANGAMPFDGAAGFYTVEAPDFGTQRNLMFYDYATLEQRYLCSAPGCTHDAPACTSYVPTTGASVDVFTVGDALYLAYFIYPEQDKPEEQWVSALEQRALDGSNPRVVARGKAMGEFGSDIFTDGSALYTLNGLQNGEMLRIDLGTGDIAYSRWPEGALPPLQGAFGRSLVALLTGGMPGAPTALCAVNVDDGSVQELHSFPQGVYGFFCGQIHEGKLYYTNLTTRVVMAYDLATGTDTPLLDKFAQQGAPIARDYAAEGLYAPEDAAKMQEEAPIEYPAAQWYAQIRGEWLFLYIGPSDAVQQQYAYNLNTGALQEITFTDYWNGRERNLQVHALTPHGFVVTQETRGLVQTEQGQDGAPYQQDRVYNVYALIAPEDLFAGAPNFRTIQPVHYGNETAVTQ